MATIASRAGRACVVAAVAVSALAAASPAAVAGDATAETFSRASRFAAQIKAPVPVSDKIADIRRAVTLTATPELVSVASLKSIMGRVFADKADAAIGSFLRACSTAQLAVSARARIFDKITVDELERTYGQPSTATPQAPWPGLRAELGRMKLLAMAPRFIGGTPHLKFIYELGSDTRDELDYDRYYALMLMPIFNIAPADEREYLGDVWALKEGKGSGPAFAQKWTTKAKLDSVKVGCAAEREPKQDWVWFQMRFDTAGGNFVPYLAAQKVPAPHGPLRDIKTSTLSYAQIDDEIIDHTDTSVERSSRMALTCSQCHRRDWRQQTLKDEVTRRDGPLDKLGIMSFFVHLTANDRNPSFGPVKSRFQNTWEDYQLELLQSLAVKLKAPEQRADNQLR